MAAEAKWVMEEHLIAAAEAEGVEEVRMVMQASDVVCQESRTSVSLAKDRVFALAASIRNEKQALEFNHD